VTRSLRVPRKNNVGMVDDFVPTNNEYSYLRVRKDYALNQNSYRMQRNTIVVPPEPEISRFNSALFNVSKFN